MKSPYLGDPKKIDLLTYVRGAPFRRHFACSYLKRAQMATRLIAPELISEPPELIPSASAAQGENLSIRTICFWTKSHQSTTKPQKIGVLDPPPHHPPDMGRAIRVWVP